MTKSHADNKASIYLQPDLMAFARQAAAADGRKLSGYIARLIQREKDSTLSKGEGHAG